MLLNYLPQNFTAFLEGHSFWGNSWGDYFGAFLAFLVFLVIFKIFQVFILYKINQLAQKTKTDIDDTLVEIIKSLRPPFYSFLAFYFALKFLKVDPLANKVINIILIGWVIYQGIYALQILINYILKKALRGKDDLHTQSALKFMGNMAKAVLWVLGALLFLSNLGVDVTSLVAGLGIGGIAIAFALQNILSDLFSSFAIYFDKPFQVGDFIMVGTDMGEVIKVGIKTTRLKTLRGEELVISNKELTSSRVQNFRKMKERRVAFSLGITYETETEKLKKIPSLLEEIIKAEKLARFDRAFFKEFGDFALVFDVVYYVESPDYMDYARTNQSIFLKIKEVFEKEGIDFAYPTQSVYLKK